VSPVRLQGRLIWDLIDTAVVAVIPGSAPAMSPKTCLLPTHSQHTVSYTQPWDKSTLRRRINLTSITTGTVTSIASLSLPHGSRVLCALLVVVHRDPLICQHANDHLAVLHPRHSLGVGLAGRSSHIHPL